MFRFGQQHLCIVDRWTDQITAYRNCRTLQTYTSSFRSNVSFSPFVYPHENLISVGDQQHSSAIRFFLLLFQTGYNSNICVIHTVLWAFILKYFSRNYSAVAVLSVFRFEYTRFYSCRSNKTCDFCPSKGQNFPSNAVSVLSKLLSEHSEIWYKCVALKCIYYCMQLGVYDVIGFASYAFSFTFSIKYRIKPKWMINYSRWFCLKANGPLALLPFFTALQNSFAITIYANSSVL